MTVNEKIAGLRKRMKESGIMAYIIPSSDPHMSEYVSDHWKCRAWISGFDGSAGTVVVTDKESGLWTDGRYFIQAENQLAGSEIKLFKMGQPDTPSYIDWLESRLEREDTAGFAGKLVSVAALKEMKGRFAGKDLKIDSRFDFISEIWTERPAIPATEVFVHEKQYTGLTAAEKVAKVREEVKKAGAEYYVLASLDDIAWLYNIRANDIAYVPVSISYAMISQENAWLFIDQTKLPGSVKAALVENGIEIENYEKIGEKLGALDKKSRIAFDPKRINCWLYDSISPECRKVEVDEITSKLKAVKNSTEIANIRNSQIKDGAAMVNFLYWLDSNIEKEVITEVTIAEKLEYFRSLQDKNLGPSFNTIAGYRDHGAMMHYSAAEESCYTLENKDMVVIDSGGQYLDGTTDITRTVVFDEVTKEQKHDFTMVLKAHIAMAKAKFLYGATGSNLDILARYPLWAKGINYRSGTGHGIGYLLSVHEGPQNLSQTVNTVKLEPGMLLTDEPGIYSDGRHGIRTENTLLVVEDEKTEYGQFLKFEVISYCPVDLRGIEPSLLTEDEREWLNDYHSKVYDILSPHLGAEERKWLQAKTMPVLTF